jgi:hypothetical protein
MAQGYCVNRDPAHRHGSFRPWGGIVFLRCIPRASPWAILTASRWEARPKAAVLWAYQGHFRNK